MNTHISISGSSLVIGGNSSYTHSTTDPRSVDVSSTGFDFVASGSTAIAAGDGLESIDVNGSTFEFGNADTITFPILNGGAVSGTWQYASSVTPPTLVADTSGALEGTLSLPTGEYQINNADISNLTISITGTGNVTVRTFNTTGDASPTSGQESRITIEALPDTRSYVVPAQAGNFIVRQTGLADTAANIKQEEITSSSTLDERTFELLADNMDTYHIYWKPTSSNSENEGYSITHIGPVTGSDVTTTETFNISNTTIADV